MVVRDESATTHVRAYCRQAIVTGNPARFDFRVYLTMAREREHRRLTVMVATRSMHVAVRKLFLCRTAHFGNFDRKI